MKEKENEIGKDIDDAEEEEMKNVVKQEEVTGKDDECEEEDKE